MATADANLTLTEEDIPGARLQEPYESHTLGELRWWLLCRGVTVASSMRKAQVIERVRQEAKAGTPVIDVDGSYIYRKKVHLNFSAISPPPDPPLTGWEVVTVNNIDEMSKNIPRVMPGLLYTYLASGCGKGESQGAFRALQRGYIHWASGRLNRLEINYRHPQYCHVRCNMIPSMKDGLYHVYLLLGKEGELAAITKAVCECAAGESATCTHISGLLHALVAMSPSQNPLPKSQDLSGNGSVEEEPLPITSFACAWKAPRKRKDNNAKISEVSFNKHVYGRQTKHTYQSLVDFDPRPAEFRGTAKEKLKGFLANVKGRGLGVSVLFDSECRVWNSDSITQMTPMSESCLPSKDELIKRVQAFKESLRLSPEKIRALERDTVDQSRSPQWYHARRYRLTASTFGRVFHMLPSTPPDSLVRQILHPQHLSTRAIVWGKSHEAEAFEKYIKHQSDCGHVGLVAVKAGFVVSEEHPFLGASPDGYVHDPGSVDQYGVLELKCPYKYRDFTPEEAASKPDFCSEVCATAAGIELKLKHNHVYYSQIQGQMAITSRKWCDFVIFTTKGVSVERIRFDPDYWKNLLLKLVDFYDNCLCPAIVSPVHLVGMKMHNLKKH